MRLPTQFFATPNPPFNDLFLAYCTWTPSLRLLKSHCFQILLFRFQVSTLSFRLLFPVGGDLWVVSGYDGLGADIHSELRHHHWFKHIANGLNDPNSKSNFRNDLCAGRSRGSCRTRCFGNRFKPLANHGGVFKSCCVIECFGDQILAMG